MKKSLEKAKKNMLLKEKKLSPYACKSNMGVWLKKDVEDIRPIFYRDIDRIIHSSGYTRLIEHFVLTMLHEHRHAWQWFNNDETYTLEISGSGEMYNFSSGVAPWFQYKNDIKYVVVEGIDFFGDNVAVEILIYDLFHLVY